VLSKRYTNPSADIIEVLAGLDTFDKLMNDLSKSLDMVIKTGDRGKLSKVSSSTAARQMISGFEYVLLGQISTTATAESSPKTTLNMKS
jgi:hypothetical protein